LVLERHEDWGQGLKMGSLLGPMLQTGAAATTTGADSDSGVREGRGERGSNNVQVIQAGSDGSEAVKEEVV
jgi:hypothetical protein